MVNDRPSEVDPSIRIRSGREKLTRPEKLCRLVVPWSSVRWETVVVPTYEARAR
jgi:hypothetical protein